MGAKPPVPTIDEIRIELEAHGITHVGVAPATPMLRARKALAERKALGFADNMSFTWRNPERSTTPTVSVAGAQSIIVAALPYLAEDVAPATGRRAHIARYARADHYSILRTALRSVARNLKMAGERAVAFADDNALVDREAAYRAGIGWFGKNANLLLPGAGSYFVLGSIITTAMYEPSQPVDDGCGSCTRCLDGCPTGAIVAPGVIDARRCLAWLLQKSGTFPTEMRAALGDRIYGCDDCQEVCPPTVRLGRRNMSSAAPGLGEWVDPLDMLTMSDDELLDTYGLWYFAERDPRWLRRNAIIVLGNTTDPNDSETLEVLQSVTDGQDVILAEHAQWAVDEIARRALQVPQ
ncbi:MAG: tRNA epoxyqueuosine(34) reductase QueG [Actinomycetota bacterium]|nr:tRNA epoxyqueuosine(34) reductase QueG [Actinomycetota bacterium]MEC8465083.1 tRNA epoxyqueuosine(34) reductase QueG [Actinomycetota bacterium]MEC8486747.1 tRNA epoxyqueuosine(34) reductase QueG [Actinomycetota bacterium]MEC8521378.1 tRNA epoxyqueuosine(34) reductase QueG [Actinomycetota bacterium]MEC9225199.1 tRNA epoxyqueuosine(34) reductase QueG [Actinomycetota bacterium]